MDHMMKVFSHTQVSMHKEGKIKNSMEGKDPSELKFNNFSGGDSEQGEQVFEHIAKSIANSHEDFYFKEQKVQQQSSSSSGGKVDKITTEIGRFGRAKKQEVMLIRQGARLNDFKEGKLDFNNNPIYK
jgi:hypothetical protein